MKTARKDFLILILASSLFIIIFYLRGLVKKTPKLPPTSLPRDLSGSLNYSQRAGIYDSKKVDIPLYVFEDGNAKEPIGKQVLSEATRSDRWIEIDLSDQKLKAWEGNSLFLETPVSTGLPWMPTPTGEFTIWLKVRATRMEGGEGRYYYNLPNVPYVMFFANDSVPKGRGYSLHGTYWHNDFGHTHSHGCVNLPTSVAKELYAWTYPMIPQGKSVVYASDDNPGTKIVIHE